MFPRGGRRPSHDDPNEPDIISPGAARLSGGRRPEPCGQGRRPDPDPGNGGLMSHEAGPPSRRPNQAGRARQADEFEDDYGDEGLKARLPRQSHDAGPHSRRSNQPGRARQADEFEDDYGDEGLKARLPRQSLAGDRHHHHAEEENGLAGVGARQKFAGVRERHHTEEGDEFETAGKPFGRQSFSGSGRHHADEEDVFKDAGELRRRHDHAGDRRNGFAEEADSFEAAGARPRQQKPLGRARGPAIRHEPAHDDNDRYGGSRRGGGNRTRERDEDELDGEIHRASQNLVSGGGKSGSSTQGAHGDSGSRRHSRYIPYTFRVLPLDYLDLLKWVFHVRSSKVEEWCEDGFIRLDRYTTKGCPYNIDPLLAQMPEKHRKVYEEVIRKNENEHDLRAIMGKDIRTVEDAIKEKDLSKRKDHSKRKDLGTKKDPRR
ncbi:MAG: hypothetical protein ALECFALPRED_005944 [Alectoria fallacina]|uniref:Uncharacterized protein n=1 Tax=Alectoria fallacina TaxID=1903189 RepID=A0A8H3G7M6_9LECA|nr:MAG: hypothetical protein ALECFALPRED_005944 [Alectoria fallacina]